MSSKWIVEKSRRDVQYRECERQELESLRDGDIESAKKYREKGQKLKGKFTPAQIPGTYPVEVVKSNK
jgi:hypothetical protein